MAATRKPGQEDLEFGSVLKRKRKSVGLTQEKISSILGISQQQYSKYERGESRMNKGLFNKAVKICEIHAQSDKPGFGETGQASYDVFHGTESVRKSIDDIRKHLDVIEQFVDLS